jgi:F-type H+-transporting ATPase subunit gamma
LTNPRELKRRIGSIQSIGRTVDAMRKISAARLSRDRQALLATRPYTNALVELVRELAAAGIHHPLLDVHEAPGYLLLAIGGDRGMCGSYNASVMRAAAEFVATRHREKLYLLTSGSKLRQFRPRTSALIIRETLRYPRPLRAEHVRELARTLVDAYLNRDVARVYFVYTEFRSATSSRPVTRRILPLMPPECPTELLFEPAATGLLDRLLPEYIELAIRAAFLEAAVSEHAARMVMMEQAVTNAKRMTGELTLAANRLRQTIITRELSDIVGTTEALA